MNPLIEEFINCKRIAVVGMSRNGKKFGNIVAKELKGKGYEIYPVHPVAGEIDGFKCWPDLVSLEGKVDALFVSVPPANVSPVLEQAASVGLKNIWLQQGTWSNEVGQTVDRLKLSVVSEKCIMMYAPPVKSIHRFHRTISGWFGKL